jgi:hypothetical protein
MEFPVAVGGGEARETVDEAVRLLTGGCRGEKFSAFFLHSVPVSALRDYNANETHRFA